MMPITKKCCFHILNHNAEKVSSLSSTYSGSLSLQLDMVLQCFSKAFSKGIENTFKVWFMKKAGAPVQGSKPPLFLTPVLFTLEQGYLL